MLRQKLPCIAYGQNDDIKRKPIEQTTSKMKTRIKTSRSIVDLRNQRLLPANKIKTRSMLKSLADLARTYQSIWYLSKNSPKIQPPMIQKISMFPQKANQTPPKPIWSTAT